MLFGCLFKSAGRDVWQTVFFNGNQSQKLRKNDIIIDNTPVKRVFAGFENMGRALEIVAIEDDEQDCLVVIHAMKLTKKYYFLLNEGG